MRTQPRMESSPTQGWRPRSSRPPLESQIRELGVGGAPMTPAQAAHLLMLCEGTNEVLDDSLTRAEAALKIAVLEQGRAAMRRQRDGL
jgi:Protein of unknown function (DUF3072)